MSLEDFGRELQGKPPKNRDMWDRMLYTDEDGCSYDQQVYVTRLPFGIGLAFVGSLLLVAWAAGGAEWDAITEKAQWIWGMLT